MTTNGKGLVTAQTAVAIAGSGGSGTPVTINGGSTLGALNVTGAIPVTCSDSTGSGTAQSCSTGLSITPTAGNCITYLTTTANSGALTLNVDSSSAYGVYKWGGSAAVAAGDIPANKPIPLCFDAANHWDASDIGNAPSGGGGLTLISKTIVPSNTSSVNVTVPSGYSAFLLQMSVAVTTSTADDNINITFNSDTTAGDYQWCEGGGNSLGGHTANSCSGSIQQAIPVGEAAGGGATGGFANWESCMIGPYNSTTPANLSIVCTSVTNRPGSGIQMATYTGFWSKATIVVPTSLQVYLSSGSVSAGSQIALYGIQ